MKTTHWWLLVTLSIMLLVPACGDPPPPSADESAGRDDLVGAWRSKIRFNSGALTEIRDLEFLCVFNLGGTMTESSNYDGAPPVPPAYGVWKKKGPHQFEAKYMFYLTSPPGTFEDIAKGGGWTPSGYGVLTESVTLSADGQSYSSTIAYNLFDQSGKSVRGGGTATGNGARITF